MVMEPAHVRRGAPRRNAASEVEARRVVGASLRLGGSEARPSPDEKFAFLFAEAFGTVSSRSIRRNEGCDVSWIR